MSAAVRLGLCSVLVVVGLAGCGGPAAPRVVLERPAGFPPEWQGRHLFHTPQAYIYARSEFAAGEADRWVDDVARYVQRRYGRSLDKGVVVVMDPIDEPFASTLDEQLALERDPALLRTRPRREPTREELRAKLADQGIPEGPVVRGATIPLPPARLAGRGLHLPDAPWIVAAPSHELAVECAIPVTAASLRKKLPRLTEEQARDYAAKVAETGAKAFEINRGPVVFMLWAQRQDDWSDEQRREAIRDYIRNTFRSHWLPVPRDEEIDW